MLICSNAVKHLPLFILPYAAIPKLITIGELNRLLQDAV